MEAIREIEELTRSDSLRDRALEIVGELKNEAVMRYESLGRNGGLKMSDRIEVANLLFLSGAWYLLDDQKNEANESFLFIPNVLRAYDPRDPHNRIDPRIQQVSDWDPLARNIRDYWTVDPKATNFDESVGAYLSVIKR